MTFFTRAKVSRRTPKDKSPSPLDPPANFPRPNPSCRGSFSSLAANTRAMIATQLLSTRPVVFLLAFLSFACLLGQFYGLWTMRFFGCWVLPPATVLLAYVAYKNRDRSEDLSS